jgi:hypothetical protein
MTTRDAEKAGGMLDLSFCDATSETFRYTDSVYGRIVAREDFEKYRLQGERNDTMFATNPHLIKVTFTLGDQVNELEFSCAHNPTYKENTA